MHYGQNMGSKKRKLSQENVNFEEIGQKFITFCGNRRNMQYASLALRGWTPLEEELHIIQ